MTQVTMHISVRRPFVFDVDMAWRFCGPSDPA
eukprot:CAMPEP_0201999512 /NCGR_PEP_ID=MMETSP0905-20130828/6080_1 /ASSEMBLY_ACC=CAM_ASM_000554 /TAXON_ID=420261 /ORGANISM="Thalassiosira antarctica, Strain CCMP982" /LENGTH=31 /DNA_ID= /DNA_START= /DNA_END= /DNA_ORIENTATION=